MALLQGVLNTFVIVLARVVGRVVDGYLSGNRDSGGGLGYYAIVFVLDMVFGLFATHDRDVVLAASRVPRRRRRRARWPAATR